MENMPLSVWDPLGEPIVPATFAADDAAILQKVQYYQQHPGRIMKVCLLWSLPLVVDIAVVVVLATLFNFEPGSMLFFIFFSGIPIFVYLTSVDRLQTSALTLLLCQSQKWLYDPADDSQTFEKLRATYPPIFQRGRDQHLTDQVWGKIVIGDKTTSFWSSSFEYTVGSGRSSHTYTYSIVALPLQTAIPVPFQIHPHAVFLDLQHMKTESEEFNKLFAITTQTYADQTKAAILGILTPSLQVRLCDFYQKYGPEMILFQDKTVLFVFTEPLWSVHYTNFFKNVAVDPRDEQAAVTYVATMVGVMDEMIQYTSE